MAHYLFVANYELIEHTADVGIRVKGKDLRDIFEEAALAMFDIIAEKKPQATGYRLQAAGFKINQKAENVEELFVNWLNELLSLYAVKEKIFCKFLFNNLDERSLEATIEGCDIKEFRINTELKAATYHQLKVERTTTGWQAEVIFDT